MYAVLFIKCLCDVYPTVAYLSTNLQLMGGKKSEATVYCVFSDSDETNKTKTNKQKSVSNV